MEVIAIDGSQVNRAEGARRLDITGAVDFGVKNLDLVLTFRNLHNFTAAGRGVLNEAAFKALKRGGLYGVVDHTRRHMQADDGENWRRMDPVLMIKEVQAAGFELVDFSDLHYRYDDALMYRGGAPQRGQATPIGSPCCSRSPRQSSVLSRGTGH